MSTNSDKLDMILHDMVINRTCGLHISRWQLFTGFILSTYNLFYSWCLFSFHFTWDNLYMCAIPPNVSLADAIPATNDTLFNKCNVYELFNKSYSNKTIPCPIGYNHTMYDQRKTFASTFGLYCDKEKYGSITENMVLTGIFIGSLLCSVIGDKFGRRPVMLAFFWIGSISGICTALSPTYWFFVLCQFISGLCSQGYGIIAYTMYLELFATSDRAICFLFALVWPLGMLMLGLFSYLATSWQHLYLATSIPMLITFSYYKLVPESIYWLAQQKNDEAVNKVLQKAYRMNKTPDSQRHTYSSDSILVHNDDGVHNNPMLKQKDDHNYFRVWLIGISEIISSFRKRKTFLVVLMISSLLLIVITFLYNGLTLAASTFSSNRDMDWFITSLLEIPSIIIVGRLVDKFGRKIPCSIGFLLVSIAFILLACLTKQIALSAVNHIAKLLVAGTYSIVWFLVPELFPTNHRNFGLGFSNALSKIFGILSPFIANQLSNNRIMFSAILAVLSLFCSIITQILWEPLGKSLCETVDDMPSLTIKSKKTFQTPVK